MKCSAFFSPNLFSSIALGLTGASLGFARPDRLWLCSGGRIRPARLSLGTTAIKVHVELDQSHILLRKQSKSLIFDNDDVVCQRSEVIPLSSVHSAPLENPIGQTLHLHHAGQQLCDSGVLKQRERERETVSDDLTGNAMTSCDPPAEPAPPPGPDRGELRLSSPPASP